MSKLLYGISKREARENFRLFLENDYFRFLEKNDYFGEECYELYIDDVFDDDCIYVSSRYICFFDGTCKEFGSLFDARAYSLSYFFDYCISLFDSSFYSLVQSGIFSRLSFSVYNSADFENSFFPDPVFSTDSIVELSEWLNVSPGNNYSLYFTFYTPYHFDKAVNVCDRNLNSCHMLFRDYLFFECDLNNVDLCDFDYIFGFLRLQERLTGYHGFDSYENGYNVFHLFIEKDKV